MKVLSLFDGMSCGQLALHKAGLFVKQYFASEVDKFAIKITQKNFPDTIQLGDVQQVRASDLPEIDLLLGGSPCQGFSFAGRQLNFDDPRSALFWEYVRLLKELRPRYFLLENVKMKQQHIDVISAAVNVEPVEINSSLVSAQNRRRLYWTNIPFDMPKDKGLVLADILENGFADRYKSHCLDANYFKGGNLKSYFEKNRRQIVFTSTETNKKFRKLSPVECERLQTVPDDYTAGVSNTQRYKMLGNGWTVDIVAHILRGIKDEQR